MDMHSYVEINIQMLKNLTKYDRGAMIALIYELIGKEDRRADH